MMIAAFLVKMTVAPALLALAAYSVASMRHRPSTVLRGHVFFHGVFVALLSGVCLVYHARTGDALWQFRSELAYYDRYRPDWYVRGEIDYIAQMLQSPRSLLWWSGYGTYRYLEHGLLFWVFLPACVGWGGRQPHGPVRFLMAFAATVLAFFQFYPQYLDPRYLPLVRQERYLEMMLPAVVIVVGAMLHHLSRRHPLGAVALMCFLVVDFVHEASRRSFLYRDSQQDVRELAQVARSLPAGKVLHADLPAKNALTYYLRDSFGVEAGGGRRLPVS